MLMDSSRETAGQTLSAFGTIWSQLVIKQVVRYMILNLVNRLLNFDGHNEFITEDPELGNLAAVPLACIASMMAVGVMRLKVGGGAMSCIVLAPMLDSWISPLLS